MEQEITVLLHGREFKELLAGRVEEFRKKYGLRKVDVEILYYLDQCGEQNTSRDIFALHTYTKGHISQSVERLQEMKYLTCEQDQKDRRCIHFQLTGEAEGIVEEARRMWEEIATVIFEGVTDEEKQMLRQVAIKMQQNMERAIKARKGVDVNESLRRKNKGLCTETGSSMPQK